MFAHRLLTGALLVWLGFSASSLAADPPAFGSVLDTGRHVFEDVVVLRVTSTHIFFRHSRGVASLPIAQLPPEARVQIESRMPRQPAAPSQVPSQPAAPPPAAPPAPGETAKPVSPKQALPRSPATRSVTLWVTLPAARPCPSPLGTGAFPGPRGLPLNWFHVHPCVYPQSLMNPEWRRLAERDFFLTAARHNPALRTRQIQAW